MRKSIVFFIGSFPVDWLGVALFVGLLMNSIDKLKSWVAWNILFTYDVDSLDSFHPIHFRKRNLKELFKEHIKRYYLKIYPYK